MNENKTQFENLLKSLVPQNPKLKSFEHYLSLNKNLTLKMYEFLRGNGSLWKISCGRKVVIPYDGEMLEAQWWLDTPRNYQRRYIDMTSDRKEETAVT